MIANYKNSIGQPFRKNQSDIFERTAGMKDLGIIHVSNRKAGELGSTFGIPILNSAN
jgi:hypothetical protein